MGVFKRLFDKERPRDCHGQNFYSDALNECPDSSDSTGIIPWIQFGFYPFKSFMDPEKYGGGVTRPMLLSLSKEFSVAVQDYPSIHYSCCVLPISIVFISILPGLASLFIIFVHWAAGVVFLLITEGIFITWLVCHCRSVCKKQRDNLKKRTNILEKMIDEKNMNQYYNENFSVYLGRKAKFLKLEFDFSMGGTPPNHTRYRNRMGRKGNVPLQQGFVPSSRVGNPQLVQQQIQLNQGFNHNQQYAPIPQQVRQNPGYNQQYAPIQQVAIHPVNLHHQGGMLPHAMPVQGYQNGMIQGQRQHPGNGGNITPYKPGQQMAKNGGASMQYPAKPNQHNSKF